MSDKKSKPKDTGKKQSLPSQTTSLAKMPVKVAMKNMSAQKRQVPLSLIGDSSQI